MALPTYLADAQDLISAVITDTTGGVSITEDSNDVNNVIRRLLNTEEYGGMSGNDLSLLVALADYAGKAIIDLAQAKGQTVDDVWDGLTDPFVQGGHVGPVVIHPTASECLEILRAPCPLHDDPSIDGSACTCDI